LFVVTPIHENYKKYLPPRYVRSTVAKLLATLPRQHQSGVPAVVLTNSAAVGRGTFRVLRKKHQRSTARGFYHPVRKGEGAWIEIVVDNVIGNTPRWAMRVPLIRELKFGTTLFHEVGHHLEHTIGAPAPRGEEAAIAWERKLGAHHIRERYWYLVPLLQFALKLRRRFACKPSP
jgi:hypothetical protein